MFSINDLFKLSLGIYNVGLRLTCIIDLVENQNVYKKVRSNNGLLALKKSDTCCICANGPSLKNVNIDELAGDIIVSNKFHLFGKAFKRQPTFCFLNDDVFVIESQRKALVEILTAYNDTHYLLTGEYEKVVNQLNPSSVDRIHYFCPWGQLFSANKKIDYTRVVPKTWNVIPQSILFAIYMGYSRIELYGFDYSLFATKAIEHCYKEDGTLGKPVLAEMLYKYTIVTHVNYEIQKRALKEGVIIVNKTPASLLDAYPIEE